MEISRLTLRGRDERYLWGLGVVLLSSIAGYGAWFFRGYARALAAGMAAEASREAPQVVYRRLQLQPHKEQEKAAILQFIATNFTNPALDLESVVLGTKANRNKINEVLKSELGMTFTSYLNKLRLAEAARMLAEPQGAPVAEIAASAGYANVSYFNKLFKEAYGCTPRSFRTQARIGQPPPAPRADGGVAP
ncbi:MAG: AraC family transcriptional regulator [Massilia sp.]|nr:AraC family transcriptional regulator [Massilia sp.]